MAENGERRGSRVGNGDVEVDKTKIYGDEVLPRTPAELQQHPRVLKCKSISRKFPSTGTAELLDGVEVPVPYNNYDSSLCGVWGYANAEVVQQKLQGPWKPVTDSKGRAIVWQMVLDYRDTCINPYKELVSVLIVVPDHFPAKKSKTRGIYQAIRKLDDKHFYAYVYKLWLNKELPIRYGRELLGADKYMDKSMVIDFNKGCTFDFNHVAGERNDPAPGVNFKGKLRLRRSPLNCIFGWWPGFIPLLNLMGTFGLRRSTLWHAMRYGYITAAWHVISPIGVIADRKFQDHSPVWTYEYEMCPFFHKVCSKQFELGAELTEMAFEPKLATTAKHLRAVLLPPWSMVKDTSKMLE